jgi:hypothetical protein
LLLSESASTRTAEFSRFTSRIFNLRAVFDFELVTDISGSTGVIFGARSLRAGCATPSAPILMSWWTICPPSSASLRAFDGVMADPDCRRDLPVRPDRIAAQLFSERRADLRRGKVVTALSHHHSQDKHQEQHQRCCDGRPDQHLANGRQSGVVHFLPSPVTQRRFGNSGERWLRSSCRLRHRAAAAQHNMLIATARIGRAAKR